MSSDAHAPPTAQSNAQRRLARLLAFVLCVGIGARASSGVLAASDGARWYEGDLALAHGLGEAVARRTEGHLVGADAFSTGDARYDGEWVFGTYLMAAFGFGQLAEREPAQRERHLARMEHCLDRLLEPSVRAFDTAAWGEDALDSLAGDDGHAAYLGYLGTALGYHRRLRPTSRFGALHDRIADALRRRLRASPTGLIETYPAESYPIDVSSTLASVMLADAANGRPTSIAREVALFRTRRHPRTGLLLQAVNARSGRAVDSPRGSGTALAAYFLSFVDRRLARELDTAVERHLYHRVAGYGVVDEYLPGERVHVDIDSGPVVFGAGVSATGFSLAGARIFRRRDRFEHTFATADLFGAPVGRNTERGFASGGPLGDAILFAMLTAGPNVADPSPRRTP